jgi:hypothetical protein
VPGKLFSKPSGDQVHMFSNSGGQIPLSSDLRNFEPFKKD